MQFWEFGLEHELRNADIVLKALQLYEKGFEECYGSSAQAEELRALAADLLNREALSDLYSVQSVLQADMTGLVQQQLGRPDLSW